MPAIFKRNFLIVTLACLLLTLAASESRAECTRPDAVRKFEDAIDYRRDFAYYTGMYSVEEFNDKTIPFRRNVHMILHEYCKYENDPAQTAELTRNLCLEVDKTIAAVDDILGGGDGRGNKTPWNKYTFEELAEIDAAYLQLCMALGPEICDERKEPLLSMKQEGTAAYEKLQSGKISMAEAVDGMAESVLRKTDYIKKQSAQQ